MARVDLVRCVVASPREPERRQIRYVPADLFDLWRHMMERRHGFAVGEVSAAPWIDQASYARAAGTLPPHAPEAVIEVRFLYPDPGPVARQVLRYFPKEEYDGIREYLVAHFDPARRQDVTETPGVFLRPKG
jgi:hypothetical protein